VKATDYIKSKLVHLKRIGINAALNPTTGGAQPDWAKGEADERHRYHARNKKRRAERENSFHKDIE
jgi:hypothetical protein